VILFVIMVVLAALLIGGMPIAFAIGVASWLYMLIADVPTVIMAQQIGTAADSWILLAMPLFILAGLLMNDTGISVRLIAFASALVGHFRGGLAMVNVVANMLFGGISGSAVADSAALGSILIPGMAKNGYPKPFAAALTSSASSIGIIIPPSLPMILFGAITGTSVGALFIAGIIPGILVGLSMIGVIYVLARRAGWRASAAFSWHTLWRTFWAASLGLLMPLILIGGILGGVFTPTEAAGVTVVYAVVVSVFFYRTLTLRALYRGLINAGILNGIVMLIIATSFTFSWVLTQQQLPQHVAEWFVSLNLSRTAFLLVVCAALIVLGCVMHGDPMLLIVVPVVYPTAIALGIDPVHFGLVAIITVAIGQQTPPVGSTLFVVSALSRQDIFTVSRANVPFIVLFTVILALLMFVPSLSTWLPRQMGLG
jgi:C4-dicarboxylate transporter DctM subunit